MTPVRLEPAASRSPVKHSTTEPLRSLTLCVNLNAETTPIYKHFEKLFALLLAKQDVLLKEHMQSHVLAIKLLSFSKEGQISHFLAYLKSSLH